MYYCAIKRKRSQQPLGVKDNRCVCFRGGHTNCDQKSNFLEYLFIFSGKRCIVTSGTTRPSKWPIIDTCVRTCLWLYSDYYMFLILFNGANVYDDTDNVTWTHPFYYWLATTVWLSPFSYHQYTKKPIFRFDGLHCWFKASLLLLLWRHHYNSCVCQRHWFISAFNLTINSLFTNIAPPFPSDYYHYIRKKGWWLPYKKEANKSIHSF